MDSLPHTHPHTHPNDGINDHAFAGGVLGKDSAAVPSTAAEASGTVRRSTSPVLKGLMDLDWLGATEMKALGLRDKDDVVKSTTMVSQQTLLLLLLLLVDTAAVSTNQGWWFPWVGE